MGDKAHQRKVTTMTTATMTTEAAAINNIGIAVRTLHITTQYRENYSDDPARPYWKCKGGSTVVVTGPAAWSIETLVEKARPRIDYANAAAEEWITGWVEVANADVLTSDEQDQMEFDGRISYRSTRLVLTFTYVVTRQGVAGTLYHAGFEDRTSLWTAHRSAAVEYGGERASVLCENLSMRGIWAVFSLA